MMSNDENTNEFIGMDVIDEPLIIVLDEDDDDIDDDLEDINSLLATIVTHREEENIVSNEISSNKEDYFPGDIRVQNLLKPSSNTKSKVFHRLTDSSHQSTELNKPIRTILIDTSFTRPTHHQRRTKQKIPPSTNHLSIDSVLSYITFDKVSDILTVSRMGSVYYCVEDLYIKIFSSLCTLDEFTNLLSQPLKQVTLSEKISITQENPRLKKFTHIRYRLIPIDSSDYLLKLKHLLLTNKNKKKVAKIIDEMQSEKQKTNHLHDKTAKKRVLTDPAECDKRLKNVTNEQKPNDTSPFEIVIEYNLYSTNKTVPSNHNLTKCSSSSIENISIDNFLSTTIPLRRLYRSKSLVYNQKHIRNRLSRSYSLPSIKFDIEDHIMLRVKSNDSIDDNHLMPMIVNVEENVQIDNSTIPNLKQSSSTSSNPFPYLNQSSCYLTPIRTPYNLYYPESLSSVYKKSKEFLSNHHSKTAFSPDSSSKQSSPIIMSLLEKPIYHRLLTSEEAISTLSDSLSSYSQQSTTSKNIRSNERMIHQYYTTKLPSPLQRKQHRMTPYTTTKTYFAPLSIPHLSINEGTDNTNTPQSKSNSSTTISSSKKSKSFCIHAQSIDLSQAIIEHNRCDMDKLPKLVVRHTKTYRNKTVDTMGQLFPTWFNEPDYRCIHCFNCDRVFTPQLFMTHVDDKQMVNKQPLNMTSIQLLTSEKLSQYKVGLWNQFCTDLTNYASKFPEAVKSKISWKTSK